MLVSREDLAYSLRATSPIFFGYLAIGIPFGLMTVSYGYPVWLALVMSVFIYAGAGQYLAIVLYASGASLWTIVLSTLVISSRHVVYGISLLDKYKLARPFEPYTIFALTDETYAIMCSLPLAKNAEASRARIVLVAALDHLYWILGSLVGALAGALLPCSFKGVEFALTALFAVLLVEQLRLSRDYIDSSFGAIVTGLALLATRVNAALTKERALPIALVISLSFVLLYRGARRGKPISKGAKGVKDA